MIGARGNRGLGPADPVDGCRTETGRGQLGLDLVGLGLGELATRHLVLDGGLERGGARCGELRLADAELGREVAEIGLAGGGGFATGVARGGPGARLGRRTGGGGEGRADLETGGGGGYGDRAAGDKQGGDGGDCPSGEKVGSSFRCQRALPVSREELFTGKPFVRGEGMASK